MSSVVPMYGFGGGGGGAAIGLKVVGGLARPANPTEGLLWAKTDVEPTGHHLSATAPENPILGMLWIKISDSSTIEIGTALGKGYLTIMLNSVSQYVNGEWKSVEAAGFQDGVWNALMVRIPFSETKWEKINPYQQDSGYKDGTYSFSVDTFKGTVTGEMMKCAICSEKLDLTGVNNIVAKWSLDKDISGGGKVVIAISPYKYLVNSSGTTVTAAAAETTAVVDGICTLPVPSDGSYYVIISIATWANKGTVNVTVSDISLM